MAWNESAASAKPPLDLSAFGAIFSGPPLAAFVSGVPLFLSEWLLWDGLLQGLGIMFTVAFYGLVLGWPLSWLLAAPLHYVFKPTTLVRTLAFVIAVAVLTGVLAVIALPAILQVEPETLGGFLTHAMWGAYFGSIFAACLARRSLRLTTRSR